MSIAIFLPALYDLRNVSSLAVYLLPSDAQVVKLIGFIPIIFK